MNKELSELATIGILEKAIETYGIDNQIEMIIEECSELILALQKWKRENKSIYTGKIPIAQKPKTMKRYFEICSEIADVKIMVKQAEIIFNKESIDLSFERKIARLENRLIKSNKPL